ncbi:MAG TPA: hypothetical protein VFV38_45805 [Ktedonobacteraceae bacterium]|nr:hypothetical protein [Ktedonobacteraceae bacterium]
MIYFVSQPFSYQVVGTAACCGEIQRVRAALIDIIAAAKTYAAAHHLEDRGSVIQGVAPL